VRYKLVAHEARPLYTWIHIAVPPHPKYFRGSYRAAAAEAGRCQTSTRFLASVTVSSAVFIYVLLPLFSCVDWSLHVYIL